MTSAPVAQAVPFVSASVALRADSASARVLMESLNVTIPPRPLPAGYRLVITFLAATLVLFSAAFTFLVLFLAWLAIFHFYNAFASYQAGPYFIFHVPMALLGLLLFIVLIKPYFSRAKENERGVIELSRQNEPLLYEYVAKLCTAVKAPMPDVIKVDCTPNAAAGLVGGVWGLFRRKSFVQIGLPLAATLSARQLTGVLGHELGHLTQRGGMTATYLVRRLNLFFARIVFQRDRFDRLLQRFRDRRNGLGVLFYYLAAACIEPARGVLWLMLMIGESLSAHFLRRMEFDADALEAQLAGPKDFEEVGRWLVFLAVADERSHARMAASWEQRRLADDFPHILVAEARALRRDHPEILGLLEKEKTRWFDTHPCHGERVAHVRSLGAHEALVACDLPATGLFANFKALCKSATQGLYTAILKDEVTKAALIDSKIMAAELAGQSQRFKALEVFLCGHMGMGGPIFPARPRLGWTYPSLDTGVEAAAGALIQVRGELEKAAAAVVRTGEKLHASRLEIMVAKAHRELADIFRFNARAQSLARRANRQLDQQMRIEAACLHESGAFVQAAQKRFTLALSIAGHQATADGRFPPADDPLRMFYPLAWQLGDHYPAMEDLMRQCIQLRVLCGAYDDRTPYPPLVDRIISTANDLLKKLKPVLSAFSEVPYPFEHATANIKIDRALKDEPLPDAKDPPKVHAFVSTCIDRYLQLCHRVLAELATVAAGAEKELGLSPLTAPKETDGAAKLKDRKGNVKGWIGYSMRAAAGLLLVGTLLAWSFSPPAMPALAWGDAPSGSYVPAAFSASIEHINRYDPSAYAMPNTNAAGGAPYSGSPGNLPGGSPLVMPSGAPKFIIRGGTLQAAVPAIPFPGQQIAEPSIASRLPAYNNRNEPANIPGTPGYNPTRPPNYTGGGLDTGAPGITNNNGLNVPGAPNYDPMRPPEYPGARAPGDPYNTAGRSGIPGGNVTNGLSNRSNPGGLPSNPRGIQTPTNPFPNAPNPNTAAGRAALNGSGRGPGGTGFRGGARGGG